MGLGVACDTGQAQCCVVSRLRTDVTNANARWFQYLAACACIVSPQMYSEGNRVYLLLAIGTFMAMALGLQNAHSLTRLACCI